MSIITQTFLDRCGRLGIFVNDNLRGTTTTAGVLAINCTRIVGAAARFTSGTGQMVAMLPSLKLGEAPTTVFVLNDSAISMFVYPYLDAANNFDVINNSAAPVAGANTGRVLIAAGNVGTFIPEGVPSQRGGNPSAAWPGNLGNWSGSVTL